MTTEIELLALHRAPAVKLEAICELYFGMSPVVARQRAALNRLPVPTFRATDSAKAPLLVRVTDLAKHIDACRDKAAREWEASQV